MVAAHAAAVHRTSFRTRAMRGPIARLLIPAKVVAAAICRMVWPRRKPRRRTVARRTARRKQAEPHELRAGR